MSAQSKSYWDASHFFSLMCHCPRCRHKARVTGMLHISSHWCVTVLDVGTKQELLGCFTFLLTDVSLSSMSAQSKSSFDEPHLSVLSLIHTSLMLSVNTINIKKWNQAGTCDFAGREMAPLSQQPTCIKMTRLHNWHGREMAPLSQQRTCIKMTRQHN